jgi:uncharacterized protein with ParB-like and HNH nuclease domain
VGTFVSKIIKGDTPYFSVIDGQQRITAILSFIRDGFSLESPYIGEYLYFFYLEFRLSTLLIIQMHIQHHQIFFC